MKDNLNIYINTKGRYKEKYQLTLKFIPESFLKYTHLVVEPSEVRKYRRIYEGNIIKLPKSNMGLSWGRQWLLDNMRGPFLCFLDDDLVFNVRRKDSTKLKRCKDISKLFQYWLKWLKEGFGIVGVSLRNGNNRVLGNWEDNTRIMSAYAFNKDTLIKENIRFDRIPVMQDFDVTLSLLEKGYKNRVSYKFAHSQGMGSNAVGGCSIYRTPSFKREGAYKLAELHPRVVKIRAKITKTGWEGMENKKGINGRVSTDVTVLWKKAYTPRGKKDTKAPTGIERFL